MIVASKNQVRQLSHIGLLLTLLFSKLKHYFVVYKQAALYHTIASEQSMSFRLC